jgi:hypothetical protein
MLFEGLSAAPVHHIMLKDSEKYCSAPRVFEDKIETESITRNESQNIVIRFFQTNQGYFERTVIFYKV